MASKKPALTDAILPGHPDYLQAKTLEIMKLIDNGLTIEQAVKLAKGKDKIHPNTKTDLKKKYDRWRLTQPAVVKLAHKAVKETLQMKAIKTGSQVICPECKGRAKEEQICALCNDVGLVHESITPTTTNRLAAAAMVMDRADPVVRQNMNLNINATVDPVDLSSYMSK